MTETLCDNADCLLECDHDGPCMLMENAPVLGQPHEPRRPASSPPSAPLAETPTRITRRELRERALAVPPPYTPPDAAELADIQHAADAELGAALRAALNGLRGGTGVVIRCWLGAPPDVAVWDDLESADPDFYDNDATRALATALRPTHDGKEKGE